MRVDSQYAPYLEEVMCVHKESYGGVEYPYHRHDGYEIFLFLKGEAYFYIEDKCFDVMPGDLYVMGPTNSHRLSTKNKDAYERVTINIKENVLQSLSSESTDLFRCFRGCEKGAVMPVTLDKATRTMITMMVDRYGKYVKSNEYGSDLRQLYHLQEILIMMNEAYAEFENERTNIMPELVSQIMVYIEKNLKNGIEVQEIANYFSYDKAYISRLFKKHTGVLLKDYITMIRLEAAKDILLAGGSVSDACYQSGFNDYANFLKSFKANTGITPGKWTKRS